MTIKAAAGSEIGRRYRENYDVLHLDVDPLLAIVIDGLGDGPGSAMAGRTTVDTLVPRIRAGTPSAALILDAIATATRQVAEYGKQIGQLAACTLTAMVETTDGFWIAHIGDSRLYRLRSGELEQLTVDHTVAWLAAVNGWYPFDSAQMAAARYRVIRCIGGRGLPEPDLMWIEPRPGDEFLLCTDGVADQVSYHQILETLGQTTDPETKVRNLLAAAEAAGGNDNATAIVVTFS